MELSLLHEVVKVKRSKYLFNPQYITIKQEEENQYFKILFDKSRQITQKELS